MNSDRHVCSCDSGKVHDLLLPKKLLGTVKCFVGNLMLCGEFHNKIVDHRLIRFHVRRPPIGLEVSHDFRREPRLDAQCGACANHSTCDRHSRPVIRMANSLSRNGTDVFHRR